MNALGFSSLMDKVSKKQMLTGKKARKRNKFVKRHNKVMSFIDADMEAFFGFLDCVEEYGLKEALKSYRQALQTHTVPEKYREWC